MSYAAEPYAQFADDLLMALTGGSVRQQFRFLPELEPFRLTSPDPIIPNTVQVFGIADGTYRRFRVHTDYDVGNEATIQWRKRGDGTPAADSVWPDEGTIFYANFESISSGGAVPRLNDRNPGSVVRLFAESFAREFAVVSRQLEEVYRAAFIDTARGRDLDQLGLLVGATRRAVTVASGSVVFARSTPAPADIFIPAGARLSTTQPPLVVFETIATETLRRGNLSVEVPVQAMAEGASGVVPANAIGVIHRPILGIETVANPTATSFGGAIENDEAFRGRARRALEGAGQATTGALMAALTTIPGLREKDIQIAEDPLAHPGVVKLNIALPANEGVEDEKMMSIATQAIDLIERTRPVGIRILPNIEAPAPVGTASSGAPLIRATVDPATMATVGDDDLFLKVDVAVQIMPTTLTLTPQQRHDLQLRGEKIVNDFLTEAGIGEVLIYNRLVARLMELDGVLDVTLDMYPHGEPNLPHDQNVMAENPAVRPTRGEVRVELGGTLVLLDVWVVIKMVDLGVGGDEQSNIAAALNEITGRLRDIFKTPFVGQVSPAILLGLIGSLRNYVVTAVHYKVEYQEAGTRISQRDVKFTLTGLEQVWVRRVEREKGEAA